MEKELKDLLLRDLCARLPYVVKVNTSYQAIDEPIQLKYIDCCQGTYAVGEGCVMIGGISFDDYLCKPYLFPMSSMTEEQKEEYNQARLKDLRMLNNVLMKRISEGDNFDRLVVAYNEIDWLNRNHFDYRGLIEKGLAIDATNLNVYPIQRKN